MLEYQATGVPLATWRYRACRKPWPPPGRRRRRHYSGARPGLGVAGKLSNNNAAQRMKPVSDALTVVQGTVVATRLFDVAYQIDLPRVEALWRANSSLNLRARLNATPPKALNFEVAPLVLPLPAVTLALGMQCISAQASARVYAFGVIAFSLRIAAHDLPWDAYVALVNDVDRVIGYGAPRDLWQRMRADLCAQLAQALVRPSSSCLEEDYLVANVKAFSRPISAQALQAEVDLVPVLSGEQRALSEQARNDLLSQRHSYYTDDLVLMTWDRAFVYEPRGDADVMEVLEVANAQLLELRYYDALLNVELPRMYALVRETRTRRLRTGPRRFAYLARKLYELVAEVSEVTEQIENALHVTQDVYLARVYNSALQLLRVPTVAQAVDRKLATIRDTYSALYEEASSSRAMVLEISIVLLIMLEIVMALGDGLH